MSGPSGGEECVRRGTWRAWRLRAAEASVDELVSLLAERARENPTLGPQTYARRARTPRGPVTAPMPLVVFTIEQRKSEATPYASFRSNLVTLDPCFVFLVCGSSVHCRPLGQPASPRRSGRRVSNARVQSFRCAEKQSCRRDQRPGTPLPGAWPEPPQKGSPTQCMKKRLTAPRRSGGTVRRKENAPKKIEDETDRSLARGTGSGGLTGRLGEPSNGTEGRRLQVLLRKEHGHIELAVTALLRSLFAPMVVVWGRIEVLVGC